MLAVATCKSWRPPRACHVLLPIDSSYSGASRRVSCLVFCVDTSGVTEVAAVTTVTFCWVRVSHGLTWTQTDGVTQRGEREMTGVQRCHYNVFATLVKNTCNILTEATF